MKDRDLRDLAKEAAEKLWWSLGKDVPLPEANRRLLLVVAAARHLDETLADYIAYITETEERQHEEG